MLKTRGETWAAVAVVLICAPIAGVLGLWGYMTATAVPLHLSAEVVSTVAQGTVAPAWKDAVARSRDIVRRRVSEQNLPGASVAVGVGRDIVWAEGFGWADLETHADVTPDTRFRIGTASTALTAVAAGLLIEEGRLSLDEPLQKYVPQYPTKEWPITLGQVMAHTAGVPMDSGDEGPLFTEHCGRPVEALPFISEVREIQAIPFGVQRNLIFEPGTAFRFSNYGYILVSAAIETASAEPFLEFMQTRVFAPLRLDHTGVDPGPVPATGQATPYFPRFSGDPRYGPDLMRPLDYSCYAGSSAFVSTPSDLVRFVQAVNSGAILKPETVTMLQTSQRLRSGAPTGYGLGWDLEEVDIAGQKVRTIGHDGQSLGGQMGSFISLPNGIVVAVLANISYADAEGMARKVAQEFTHAMNRPAHVSMPSQ